MKKSIALLFFIICLIASKSSAEENQVIIESNELFATQMPAKSIFNGDVYAYDNEIKLWADKVIVNFSDPNNRIDNIEGVGSVKLIRNNEEVSADKIFYNLKDKLVEARGNIRASQDGNIIKGDELDMDLNNSTSIMRSSNNNRVNAIIIK